MSGRAARRARKGFTMVEVMMGLAILAVGAATVIALLKFTVLGALDARHVANSSIVSAGHIERLHTAALAWNDADNNTADLSQMDTGPVPGLGAAAIAARTTPGVTQPNGWVYFGGSAENASSTLNGDPANTSGPDNTAYCTHIRVTWISRPSLNSPTVGPPGDNFRVEMRTIWARSGRAIRADCAATPATFTALFDSPTATATIGGAVRSRAEYGVVYMNTIVRRNTL